MNKTNLDQLIAEAIEIDAQEAKEAGHLGFMSRSLVQATMPHRKVEGNEFIRKNGDFTLTILAPSDSGIPYGSIPRLLLSWLTTEAVRTKQKEVFLGNTLKKFMDELDLIPSGGKRGDITRLKTQVKRLINATIICNYEDGNQIAAMKVQPIYKAKLWKWDIDGTGKIVSNGENEIAKVNEKSDSIIVLGSDFYKEIIDYPVPVDMRVLKAIKHSSLAIDIYCWLTYRMSYLKKKTCIPWEALKMQFGSDYKLTRQFKAAFVKQLRMVNGFYSCKVEPNDKGLVLEPSLPHIKRAR